MKHTPGPWYKQRLKPDKPEWSGWKIGVEPGREVGPPDVATVDDVDYGPEVAEANARLIAAAPDLLWALKIALSLMNVEGENDLKEWQEGVEAIKAAIAKAGAA